MPRYNTLCFAFTDVVKGKNFMSPTLLGYVELRHGVAEITTGKFMNLTMYGVTIVLHGKKSDLSQCVNSLEECVEVLKNLI